MASERLEYRLDYLRAPNGPRRPVLPRKKVFFDPADVDITSGYYFGNAFQNRCEEQGWKRDEIMAVMEVAEYWRPRDYPDDRWWFYDVLEQFCIFPEGYVVPRPTS